MPQRLHRPVRAALVGAKHIESPLALGAAHRGIAQQSKQRIGQLFGPDLNELRVRANEVNAILAGIPGVIENHVEFQEEIPQIRVEVNLAAAQQYGIKPGDVRRAAGRLIAGEEVGDVFFGGKAYDVQVWSTPETRRSLPDVKNLLIDTPTGD